MLATTARSPEPQSWGATQKNWKKKYQQTSRSDCGESHSPWYTTMTHGLCYWPWCPLTSLTLHLQPLDTLFLYLHFLTLNSPYLRPSIFFIFSPFSLNFTQNHPLSLNLSSSSIISISFFFFFFKLISSTIPILFFHLFLLIFSKFLYFLLQIFLFRF